MGKPKGTMADQLKGVVTKIATDAAAVAAAEKRAAEEKRRQAEDARARARDARSDDEVFVEAMISVGRTDVGRKFDQAPPPAAAAPRKDAPPPPSDEDLFTAAVGRLKRPG